MGGIECVHKRVLRQCQQAIEHEKRHWCFLNRCQWLFCLLSSHGRRGGAKAECVYGSSRNGLQTSYSYNANLQKVMYWRVFLVKECVIFMLCQCGGSLFASSIPNRLKWDKSICFSRVQIVYTEWERNISYRWICAWKSTKASDWPRALLSSTPSFMGRHGHSFHKEDYVSPTFKWS